MNAKKLIFNQLHQLAGEYGEPMRDQILTMSHISADERPETSRIINAITLIEVTAEASAPATAWGKSTATTVEVAKPASCTNSYSF